MAALTDHTQNLLHDMKNLLNLEHEEAHIRNQNLLSDKSTRQLENEGLLIRRPILDEELPALGGQVKLIFREDPSRKGHLQDFAGRTGAVVRLLLVDENHAVAAQGVISRIGEDHIHIVTPDTLELYSSYHILLCNDEKTLSLLSNAIDTCLAAEGKLARLLNTILGSENPKPTRAQELKFFDQKLNKEQKTAAIHGVWAPDIGLVHGPFGTGKTRVLVEIARQLTQQRGERILCTASSNAATDHLALSLLRADPNLALTRVGHPARVHPALESHTLASQTENHERRKMAEKLYKEAFAVQAQMSRRSAERGRPDRAKIKELRQEMRSLLKEARGLEAQATHDVLERSRIICGTLNGYLNYVPEDICFQSTLIDEASQALNPSVLRALLRSERVVLAGDHKQLPPTLLHPNAQQHPAARPLFEHLMEAEDAHEHGEMLKVQHRMSDELMTFPSKTFYDGLLRAHPSVMKRKLEDLIVENQPILCADKPLDVIDTAGAGLEEQLHMQTESRENPGHAQWVVRLVEALIQAGLSPKQIGVTTPYKAQVAFLHHQLTDLIISGLEVDTVDAFQGREKSVMIFDTVRSNSDGQVGFLADRRRVNVAMTRAQHQLIVLADSATLSHDPVWSDFFDHAMSSGAYRSVFELASLQEFV